MQAFWGPRAGMRTTDFSVAYRHKLTLGALFAGRRPLQSGRGAQTRASPRNVTASTASPVQASVLFLSIREFATLTVTEQARQREQLADVLQRLLPHWREDARLVLESIDGAAIVSLTGPLRVLEATQADLADNDFAVTLHHGAVRAVQMRGDVMLTGDGVDTARAIAARPGVHPPTATREFRRALLAAAPERGESLQRAGEYMDERLRSHELFEVDPGAMQRRKQRRLLIGAFTVAGILAVGGAGRMLRSRWSAARQPAVVQLDIRPVGEIWVDGELKGSSPPLTKVAVQPGPHVIEVRNARYKTMRTEVNVQPGEEVELRHVFTGPVQPRRPRSWWDRITNW